MTAGNVIERLNQHLATFESGISLEAFRGFSLRLLARTDFELLNYESAWTLSNEHLDHPIETLY